MPPRRLAVVLSHPTQYYSPWFRWLCARGFTLRVFYLWDFGVRPTRDRQFGGTFAWDVDLLSGYDSEFVPNQSGDPGTHHFMGLRNPGLTGRLSAWGPDCILLFGYRYATHLALVAWARARGVPLLFRGDSHLLGRPAPGWAARAGLGLLFSQFQGFLYVGQANRDYFRAFGVPERRLFFAPHCVDASRFEATEDARRAAAQLKASLGLADRRVILFAGKLVGAKQPLELLRAFERASRPGWALVFVGDGAERAELERRAASAGAEVRLLAFANQSEMPSRYLMADLFCLPSRGVYETWGLAVNEAMHLGVPCLVSTRVGCQRDLVIPGQTGWTFDPDAPDALEAGLTRAMAAVEAEAGGGALAARVRSTAAAYSFEAAAAGLALAMGSLADPTP